VEKSFVIVFLAESCQTQNFERHARRAVGWRAKNDSFMTFDILKTEASILRGEGRFSALLASSLLISAWHLYASWL
jgi:hypothetical protein